MPETRQHPETRRRAAWECVALGDLRESARFDEFVGHAYARLLALARQFVGSPDDAADVVQTAFLELHQVVTERLAEPRAIAIGFMYERVRWRAHDRIRERRRQPVPVGAVADPEESPAYAETLLAGPAGATGDHPAPDLEAIVTAIEKSAVIRRAGTQLAGRSRAVFDLLIEAERPVDIARELGISKARVSQLMRILFAQLETRLREEGWECSETLGVPLNLRPERTLER